MPPVAGCWILSPSSFCPPNSFPPLLLLHPPILSFTRKPPLHRRFQVSAHPPTSATSTSQHQHNNTPTTIHEDSNHTHLLVLNTTTTAVLQDLVQTLRALPSETQTFQFLINQIEIECGFLTTPISIINDLLAALITADEFELALRFYSSLLSHGLVPDYRTYSLLLTCYCNQNDPFGAKNVLDHMLGEGMHPDVATFTTLIDSFCKSGRTQVAFEVFEIMGTLGCEPTINTYNCLLKGLCYVGRVEEAHRLLTKIKKESSSFSKKKQPDIYSYTAVMNGLCKVGRSDEALDLLDEALTLGLTPNAVTYNTLLNGYFKEGRPLDGIDLLKRMKERRCSPDYVTYSTLLHGLLKWGEIQAAFNVYREMEAIGVGVDERLMNTLLRGLCRRAREEEHYLKDVYKLFERMRSADRAICPLAYNMVIEAYCSGREVDKAVVNFREMIGMGNCPKSITFGNVVGALCGEGKVDEAVSLLDLMLQQSENGVAVSVLFDILIDELNRHGMFVYAYTVYGLALKRGVVPRRKPRATSSVTHQAKRLPRSYRHGVGVAYSHKSSRCSYCY